MSSLLDEALKEKYRMNAINDPLAFMKDAIDLSAFPPLLKDLYHNDTDRGGRPNIPIITMVKVLFLQSVFNMVDEQAEKEIHDRISFMNFLDYPQSWGMQRPYGTSGKGYRKQEETGSYGTNCRDSLNSRA